MSPPTRHLWILVPEYPPVIGGTGQMAKGLAEALASQSNCPYHVTVFTSDGPGKVGLEIPPAFSRRLEIHRQRIPFRVPHCLDATFLSLVVYSLKTLCLGLWLSTRKRPDLIHAYPVLPTGWIGLLLARLLGIPLLVSAIGAELDDPFSRRALLKHPLYRYFLRRILFGAKGVSAISQHIASLVKQWGYSQVKVLAPGFQADDANVPGNGLARQKPSPGKALTFVTLARLAKRKGLDMLLQGLSHLPDNHWRLLLIGDGPQRAELEHMAKDLGIDRQVEFLGFVDDAQKYALMRQADVFVLPTLFEGFGIAYLEAMHCRLPVIATGQGGHEDFISDGHNGYWVRPRTTENLTAVLIRLYQDREQVQRIGKAAFETAQAFRVESIAPLYDKWYAETLNAISQPGQEKRGHHGDLP